MDLVEGKRAMASTTQPLTGVFDANRTHSSFQFGVRHMKISTFRASFRDVDARLTADAAGIRLEGAARVESISIVDPPAFREHVLRDAEFFDADNHPEILFRSERVELVEDGTATVEGELTMRGVSRPLTATGTWGGPVEDPFGLQRVALELRAVLDRRAWGMDWQHQLPGGADLLGWDVELIVQLEVVGQR
jgi:polyisoprenoid-binding protein YceI